MAEAVMTARTKGVSARRFYVWMAATCFAIAVLGFMPTYFVPMLHGQFNAPPIVHIHGVVLFSWVAFFFAQTWLVANGRTLDHRAWGVLGVSIVTAMAFIVTAVVSMRIAQASLPGQPAGLAHDVRAFAWVSMGGLLFIVPVFVLAIVNIRKSEIHKRLMLLMTISMLPAPIARWFLVLMAPPADPNAPLPPAGLPVILVPPVFVSIPPSLVADLLVIAAIVYDWRTRGRPHPVYVYGGIALIAVKLLNWPISLTPLWQSFAGGILAMAQ